MFCHMTVPLIGYGDGLMSHGVSLLDFNYQGESGCGTLYRVLPSTDDKLYCCARVLGMKTKGLGRTAGSK